MPTWVTDYLSAATPYWPFIVQVLVLWYLGQFAKKQLWTKARAAKGGFYAEMRATLPAHPLVVGALWGALYPWAPAVNFITTRGGAVNEGLLAGLISVVGYVGLEQYATAKNITWLLAILKEAVPEPSNSESPAPLSAPKDAV
jgi:hypothetical protein